MITVKELREMLDGKTDDLIVVLQQDAGGNRYRYIRGIECIVDHKDASYFDEETRDCYRRSELPDGITPENQNYPQVAIVF